MTFTNKTIIISGASRGIGRATALLLAQNGANIVATARTAEDLEALEAEHANIVGVPGDVANEADMTAVVKTALDRFGRIDVVINNAGYGIFKNVDEISADEWDGLMATNVKGTFLLTKAALPTLKAQKQGHVVVVASDVAKRTFAGGSLYTASKYAQEAFMGALRKEVRPLGIKVSGVYTGLVDSHFHDKGAWSRNSAELAERAGRCRVHAVYPEPPRPRCHRRIHGAPAGAGVLTAHRL
jgi:NADP-dependent 3-hydroxy acid dehydrogenase YdfG